jgi:pyridinium-3,5-bisthiocarboxylic acid mononucleotide nickel chelatase
MKTLYLDCISGISGDMTVGALIDLGVKPSALEWEIEKLNLGHFHMHFDRAKRKDIEGVKFDIHGGETCGHDHDHDHGHDHEHAHDHEHTHADGHTHSHDHDHKNEHSHGEECCGHDHSHDAHSHSHSHDHDHGHLHSHGHDHGHVHGRTHKEIKALISASELSDEVKKRSLAIFRRIAEAEGKIHGMSVEDVHFHEVGALDSIADIVLTCVGLEALGVGRVVCSPLKDGHGTVNCAHGTFPVPAPATLEILRGIPLGQLDVPHELITPTGAAIVAEFAENFGLMPTMKVERIGYGVGSRELKDRPNVLRAVLGMAE